MQLNQFILALAIGVLYVNVGQRIDAQVLSRPYMITFDTGNRSPEAIAYQSRILAEFMPPGKVRVYTPEEIRAVQIYGPRNPAGFESITGTAISTNAEGKPVKYHFRLLADESIFREYIEREISRRGAGVKVEGTDFNVQLSGLVLPPAAPGKPTISWDDVCFGYGNDVLVTGRTPTVFSVPFPALADQSEVGRGKDWCLWLNPGNVSASHRASFFRQLELHLGVSLQRRDNEPVEQHAVRRLFGQNYLDVFHSLLFDVEECLVWRQDPRDDRGFQAHLNVRLRPDSEFAKLVRELRPRRPVADYHPENALIAGRADFSIPEMFRPALLALIANSSFRDTQIAEAADETIRSGQCDVTACMKADEKAQLMISGIARVELPTIDPTVIAAAFNGTVNPDGLALIPLSVDVWGETVDEYQIACALDDSMLRFALAPQGAEFDLNDETADNATSALANAPLIALHLDLGHGSDEKLNAKKTKLLSEVEKAYQRWMFFQMPDKFRHIYRYTSPMKDFTSIADRVMIEGDWKFDVVVKSSGDGETFTADCRMGRELYGLLAARHTLTIAALEGLEPTPGPAVPKVP